MSFFERLNGDVANVHLISGEDIIGVVTETDEGYRIEKPVIPNVAIDPQGTNFRVGLMPLRPYLDLKDITIPRVHVIFAVKVAKNMAEVYRRFTSDIVVASPSDVPAIQGQINKLLKG